jgi:hypothetical protein
MQDIKMEKDKAHIQFFNDLKYIDKNQRIYTINKKRQQVSVNDLIIGHDYFVDKKESRNSPSPIEICTLWAKEYSMNNTIVTLLFSSPDLKRFTKTVSKSDFDNIKSVYTEKFDKNFIETHYIDIVKINDNQRFNLEININGKLKCVRKTYKNK